MSKQLKLPLLILLSIVMFRGSLEFAMADATESETLLTTKTAGNAKTRVALAPEDDGSVWQATREWTEEEETKYSQWIEAHLDENFFVRHKIPTDCADVPYALRFIYARNNSLPQGAHDLWDNRFGNWSKRFRHLPRGSHWTRDKRFLAALEFLTLHFTVVRSLPHDTYPIALSPEAGRIRPGTIILNDQHAAVVYSVDRSNFFPIKLAYSTLPPTIRPMVMVNYEEEFNYKKEGQGLVNWNWWRASKDGKGYEILADDKMQGYSMEQYDLPRYNLAESLQRIYSTIDDDPDKALDEMISSLKSALAMRSEVVQRGYRAYRGVKSRDKGTELYDNYSTPGRDERVMGKFKSMHQFVKRGIYDKNTLVERLRAEKIEPADLPEINLLEFRHAMINGLVSPEPWDPPRKRWGILKARLNWYRQLPDSTFMIEWSEDGNLIALATAMPSAIITPDGKPLDMDINLHKQYAKRAGERITLRKRYGLGRASQDPGDVGYDPDPLVLEDESAIAAKANGDYARVSSDGNRLWEREIFGHIYVPPVRLNETTTLIANDSGTLAAIDIESGETLWTRSLSGSVFRKPLVDGKGRIYVSSGSTLHAFESDGSKLWRCKLPDRLYASPTLGPGGRLYLGCLDTRFYCITPKGEIAWSFPTETAVLNRALVEDETGRVYAVTMGNVLYCLTPRE